MANFTEPPNPHTWRAALTEGIDPLKAKTWDIHRINSSEYATTAFVFSKDTNLINASCSYARSVTTLADECSLVEQLALISDNKMTTT